MRPLLVLGVCLFICVSCSFEPRYERPYIDMPECWRVEASTTCTEANVRWWELFEDPILQQLILTALENNKDLKVAIWRVCQYYANYMVARAPLFPQIYAQTTDLREKFPEGAAIFLPNNFDPITSSYMWEFTLSYEVDFWGQIRSGMHVAYEELLAQVENRRTVVLTLVASVSQSYIRLRELDKELEIANKTLDARTEYLRLATLRFEGGLTSEIEVTQARSLYDQARVAVEQIKEYIPQEENLLSVLLGEPPTCILRGKSLDELLVPCEIPAGIPSDLLMNRPDIAGAENMLIAAGAQIGVARAAFFPLITLTGLYGGASVQFSNLFSGPARTWAFGGNILQPIFTGGMLTGQLRMSEAEQKEALYQYEQTILTAFKEVEDALIAFQQTKQIVAIEKDRVKTLKEYLHLAFLRYYEGQTDYLTVLNAEQEFFNSQIQLAEAEGKVLLSLIDIYKSLGGGWVLDADCAALGY